MTVYVKTLGKLAERAPADTRVTLREGACLQDLLDTLDIKAEEVMLAFVNDSLAKPASPLTPECRVYLSPFICGG